MILKNRLYKKEDPKKDAKLIIIYCEGKKREDQYFNYFSDISSNIRLEIEAPKDGDDNSPDGLYNKAKNHIIETDQPPKYELTDTDEVWFVIDTDDWGDDIDQLRGDCQNHINWEVAQSNPCFEVWLFYHIFEYEEFTDMEISKNWKFHLNNKIAGGFNSKKHPVYIKDAIKNSKCQFEKTNDINKVGNTEVFRLAESILSLVSDKIDKISHRI